MYLRIVLSGLIACHAKSSFLLHLGTRENNTATATASLHRQQLPSRTDNGIYHALSWTHAELMQTEFEVIYMGGVLNLLYMDSVFNLSIHH